MSRVINSSPLLHSSQRSYYQASEASISQYEVSELSLKFGYGHNFVAKNGLYFSIALLFGRSIFESFHSDDSSTKVQSNANSSGGIAGLGVNRKNWFLGMSTVSNSSSVRFDAFTASIVHLTYDTFIGLRF